MTLEERARQASQAVKGTVAEFKTSASVAGLLRRQLWSRITNVAMAATFIVAAVFAASLLRAPVTEPDVADEQRDEIVEEKDEVVEPVDPELTSEQAPPSEGEVEEPDGVVTAPAEEPKEEEPVEEEPIPEPDTTPPPIVITSPTEGQRFEEKTIRFEGETEPGAIVTAGPYEADVTEEGHWAIVLVLSEGANGATFKATDAAGNSATAHVTVHYDPPAPPPPPEVEFTAFAQFGECTLDPPFDIYYGTASPESKITVMSEFGGGVTFANAEGDFEIKVFFPEAPYGETFLVKVKDAAGNFKHFEFTSFAGGA